MLDQAELLDAFFVINQGLLLLVNEIPDQDLFIVAGRNQVSAIISEYQRRDATRVAQEAVSALRCDHIIDPDRVILGRSDHNQLQGVEQDFDHRLAVDLIVMRLASLDAVVDNHAAVHAPVSQEPAGFIKAHVEHKAVLNLF